ncbi:MAG: histidine phosphotransferase family protein [Rhodobacteraceae bacterium]|nr:histidine phosphotransferase family protein [Paracoccaceae bacterium]
MSYVSLADLIGSRLCHDLINPLGAIGNGVELIDMTGSAKGPEMDLIRDAVRDAQARIRFFRIAFGASLKGQMLGAPEAAMALSDYFKSSRMMPDWTPKTDLPRIEVKFALLMVLCAESALPMGGALTVAQDGPGQWRVTADAARIQVDDRVWQVLRFGPAALERDLRPAEVQFAALHVLAEQMDRTVNYVETGDGLTMTTG